MHNRPVNEIKHSLPIEGWTLDLASEIRLSRSQTILSWNGRNHIAAHMDLHKQNSYSLFTKVFARLFSKSRVPPVPLRRTLDKSEKMRYNIPTKLIEIRML